MADVAEGEGWGAVEELRGRRRSRCAGSPGMADNEMEAARALADLAVGGGDALAGGLPHPPAVAAFPDLDQGCLPDDRERNRKVHKFLAKKARKGCGSFIPKPKCSRMQGTLLRSGSADALNQDDKEAKRMRRVLANRESARQTIRRRQALRDDLTKRVSELILENERLKIEKELVTKDYMLLKDRNQNLRSQIMIADGKKDSPISEAVYELARKSKSKRPSSSIKFLPSTCNNEKPLPQLFWPPMSAHLVHPCSNIQSGWRGMVCVCSQVDRHKWLNPSMVPFCLVPCPWFHPMPTDNCSHSHPTQSSVENAKLVVNTSVNKAIEVPRLPQITCQESSSSHNGSGHSSIVMQSCYEKPWTRMPPKGRLIEAKSTNVFKSDEEHVALCFMACHGPSMKAMGGLIAAGARKRRKEITKLKIQFSQKRRLTCAMKVV